MTSSARRALAILEVVNSSSEPQGVTAIAEAVGTLPGTAFRSLDALERSEFVSRYRASTQYQVGPAARRLKHTGYAQFALRNIAMPFLRRLSYASGDTVSVTVPVGWYALRLATVSGNRPVRSASATGLVGTLVQDFAGLAILAGQDEATITRIFNEAVPASGSRPDPAGTRATLAEIIARGYALSSEDAPHVSIALPIRYRGITIAAVAIEGFIPDLQKGNASPCPTEWQVIVDDMQAYISELDPLPLNPFAHLDPAEIARLLSPSYFRN
jgi:DNA-binding IclR family transcriptional regulator